MNVPNIPLWQQILRTDLLPAIHWFAIHVRTRRLVRATASAFALATAILLAEAVADRYFSLPAAARIAVLAASLVLFLAITARAVLRRLHLPPNLILARELERAASIPRESLTTLIAQNASPAPGVSAAMLGMLAGNVAASIAAARPLTLPSVKKPCAAAGASVIVASILLTIPHLQLGQVIPRVLTPWRAAEPIAGPHIAAQPGDTTVRQGQGVTVIATLSGAPGPLFIEVSRDLKSWTRSEMTDRGALIYAVELAKLDRSLHYRVVHLNADSDPDAVSGPFLITLQTTPALLDISADSATPANTTPGVAPDTVPQPVVHATPQPLSPDPNQFDLTTRAGSTLTLRLTATEPLAAATLLAPGEPLPFTITPANPTSATLLLPRSLTTRPATPLTLSLRAAAGGTAAATLNLHTTPDAHPTLRILRPTDASAAAPGDDLEVALEAHDDNALASIRLTATSVPRIPVLETDPTAFLAAPAVFDFPLAGSPARASITRRVSLASLDSREGDTLQLSAIAIDSAGNESPPAEVKVIVTATAPEPLAAARVELLTSAAAHLSATLAATDRLIASLDHAATAEDAEDIDNATTTAFEQLQLATEGLQRFQRSLGQYIRLSPSPEASEHSIALANRAIDTSLALRFTTTNLPTTTGRALSALTTRLATARTSLQSIDTPLKLVRRAQLAAILLHPGPQLPPIDDDLRNLPPPALQEIVTDADRELSRLNRTDLIPLARTATPPAQGETPPLVARLDLDWRLESLRPDTNPRRAADLALASQTASALLARGILPAEYADALEILTTASSTHLDSQEESLLAQRARETLTTELARAGATPSRTVQTLATIADAVDRARPLGNPDTPAARRTVILGQARDQLARAHALLTAPTPNPATVATALNQVLRILPPAERPTDTTLRAANQSRLIRLSARQATIAAARIQAGQCIELLRSPNPNLATAREQLEDLATILNVAIAQSLRSSAESLLATLPELSSYFAAATPSRPPDPPPPPRPALDDTTLPPAYRDAIQAYFDHLAALQPKTGGPKK